MSAGADCICGRPISTRQSLLCSGSGKRGRPHHTSKPYYDVFLLPEQNAKSLYTKSLLEKRHLIHCLIYPLIQDLMLKRDELRRFKSTY